MGNKESNIYYFANIECPACKALIGLNDLITDDQMIKVLRNRSDIESDDESDDDDEDEDESAEEHVESKILDLCESSDECENILSHSSNESNAYDNSDNSISTQTSTDANIPKLEMCALSLPPLIPMESNDDSTCSGCSE